MPTFSPAPGKVMPPSLITSDPITQPSFAPVLKQMMGVQERKLAHDVIQLKEEVRSLAKEVDDLKLANTAQQRLLQQELPKGDLPQGEFPKSDNDLLASFTRLAEMQSRAERSNFEQFQSLRTTVANAERKASSAIQELQNLRMQGFSKPPSQLGDEARDEALKENADARKKMYGDAEKPRRDLEAVAAALRQHPDVGQPRNNASASHENSRTWEKTLELDAKVDIVFGELKLVALRTTRIALRAVDMSPDDRQAALQAVDRAVDQNGDQEGSIDIAGAESWRSYSEVSSRYEFQTARNEFQTAIADIASLAMSQDIGGRGSRTDSYDAWHHSATLRPQLCTVGDERRYFTGTVANTGT